MKWIVFYSFLLSLGCSFSQGNLYGIVKNELNESLPFAGVHISYSQSNEVHHLFADEFGRFGLENLPLGLYEIKTTCIYHETQVQVISIKSGNNNMVMTLTDTSEILDAVNIYYDSHFATRKMGTVEGMYLTNGIKTHHIDPKRIDANKAIDNARELYAKVPGLNIWESDAGGLQLGTAGVSRMLIDSSGNVGINNTNPSAFNSLGGLQTVIGNGSGNASTVVEQPQPTKKVPKLKMKFEGFK